MSNNFSLSLSLLKTKILKIKKSLIYENSYFMMWLFCVLNFGLRIYLLSFIFIEITFVGVHTLLSANYTNVWL